MAFRGAGFQFVVEVVAYSAIGAARKGQHEAGQGRAGGQQVRAAEHQLRPRGQRELRQQCAGFQHPARQHLM